jgi:hypothetical protein
MARSRFRVTVSILLIFLSSMAWVSPAAAESTAVCAATWSVTISPGVTSEPGKNTMTSNGPTGTLVCQGLVKGQTVTGPGTLGEVGEFEGTCATGAGQALMSFTFPTASGPVTISVKTRFVFGPGVGLRLSDQIPGPFEFVATRGDCITAPVTEVKLFNQVLFRVES